jgi:O-acetylserine/cysteine efflux transporter
MIMVIAAFTALESGQRRNHHDRLLSRYPSGNVVPWVLLAPVVAMAAAWALLGENPGPAELSGAALLVIGVLTAQGTLRIQHHVAPHHPDPHLPDRARHTALHR